MESHHICSPAVPLPTDTYASLEHAKKDAMDYAKSQGFALAVKRSMKWGKPPQIRKVWMRCSQGGEPPSLQHQEPLRQKISMRAGCPKGTDGTKDIHSTVM
ncbi:hypothetical protein PsorP6_011866 [Peronosclerospora sorghi]|uniref:Uncharacterized protein n=1 Tax=Peronosclerospora sorghi TaxID=230839 RepID=A0ACC0WKM3_9STRA|nr:hypothetical protein PsorP6_011866 [Peronosclerospora sorghi]